MAKKSLRQRRRLVLPWWCTVLVLLLTAFIVPLTVVAIQPGSFGETMAVFTQDGLLFVLNAFPVAVVVLLLWAVIGNPFYASGLTALLFHIMSYINMLKIEARGEPFVPDDLVLWREATNSANESAINMHWGLVILIFGISILLFVAGFFTHSQRPKWFWRVGCGAAVAGLFVLSMFTVYTNKEIYDNRAGGMDKSDVQDAFETCGFIYSFLHNYRIYDVEKPEGYDESLVAQWAEERETYQKPEVQPNVIFIMCEAYSDLSEEDVFTYTGENDPMASFKKVASSDRAVTGHIVVSNFGAGTANTEFDVLTGIQTNMLAENTTSAFSTLHKDLNSLPRAFGRAGYQTYFMHPGHSWFYGRDKIYRYFGVEDLVFNEVFDEEDKMGDYISDAAFLEQLISDLDERIAKEEPLFVYSVTIQNHQAYSYSKYDFALKEVPVKAELTQKQMETLSVYMQGVEDSSRMLLGLTEYLNTVEEPTLLVFFGDHQPTLLPDYEVYEALGLNRGDINSGDSTLDTYKTPYLIWANEAYAGNCGFADLELPEMISSNYLGAVVYELTGLKGMDPYFDELTKIRRELPVISHGYYVLKDGSIAEELSEEHQRLLERLDFWKYYRLKDEPLIK